MRCHYEVLGLLQNATNDDIKKAYRKYALQWHPGLSFCNISYRNTQLLIHDTVPNRTNPNATKLERILNEFYRDFC